MVFSMLDDGAIWLAESRDGKTWSEPRKVCELPGEKLSRPKITADSSGEMWITCQTDHWG